MRNSDNQKHKDVKLKIVLTVVFLALVVLMGVFLVLRCLSFDKNGAHVIDRYGVIEAEGSASGLVDYSQYGKADKKLSKNTKKTEKKVKKSTDTAQKADKIRAITVSAQDLTYDDDYRNQMISLAQQGVIDTVVVDLKNIDGYLSEQITTSAFDTSTVQTVYSDEFPQAVSELKSAGIRIIGRVYAFSDNMATRQNSDLSCWYADAGTNWLDKQNNRWLDPTDSQAVQYICDIVKKGVEIGCDEILLANFCFPQGATELISFDGDASNYSNVIANDLSQVKAAAGNVPISLYIESSSDEREKTGQDLTALSAEIYRIAAPRSLTQSDGQMLSMKNIICQWYTDAGAWMGNGECAIYDTNGDVYQIFHLG